MIKYVAAPRACPRTAISSPFASAGDFSKPVFAVIKDSTVTTVAMTGDDCDILIIIIIIAFTGAI